MDSKFLIERHGKKYALYQGLLDEAHSKGLKSIDTELLQVPSEDNSMVAICKARVEMDGEKIYSGIGDASPENVGRTIQPHIIRMAECVPLGSEILTRDGWKRHDAVEVGEQVLAYQVEADMLRWTELEAINVFDAAPIVTLKGRSFEVSCTPEHSWAVSRQKQKRMLRKTRDFKTTDSIVVAARAEDGPLRMGARLAAILGWLATDGGLRSSTVTDKYGTWGPYWKANIAQSKPRYVEEIRALLQDGASEAIYAPYERKMPSGQVSTCTKSHRWALRTELVKGIVSAVGFTGWRDLPRIVLHLDGESRSAMLDAMLKGDGHRKRNGKAWVFGKKRKPGVMEAFELLCTLEGRALGRLGVSSAGEVPMRTMRTNRLVNTNYLKIEDDGAAKVWCPTTRFGTWIMRQGHTITITGNTRAKARALRDAVNVGIAALEELSDGDEASAPTQLHQGPQRATESRQEASQRPSPQRLASLDQKKLLRDLLIISRGEQGVVKLEGHIGKSIDELTNQEAEQWIDRLTVEEKTQ